LAAEHRASQQKQKEEGIKIRKDPLEGLIGMRGQINERNEIQRER
jgi:hypothetical protein